MPTGYTDAIKDGISFRMFAMNCARAFGACVMLRDESGGGEKIPEAFKPSDYSARRLRETREHIAEIEAMNDAACDKAAAKEWKDESDRREQRIREKTALRLKYEAMLAEAHAWTPPTPDHVELRNFMISQIAQSIDFDCGISQYDKPPPKLSGAEWRAERLAQLYKDIAYYERENAAEIERTNQRNEWISALRESLKETS